MDFQELHRNPDAVRLDYPAAARAIALHLREFCDESLPYTDMIADAARQAKAEIDRLRASVVAWKEAGALNTRGGTHDHGRSP